MIRETKFEDARACLPGSNPLLWLTWALFGNDDDGIYGDSGWSPERKTDAGTAIKWWFRNPFHNLAFYVPPFGWCWTNTTWRKAYIGNWTFGPGRFTVFPYIGYAKKGVTQGLHWLERLLLRAEIAR